MSNIMITGASSGVGLALAHLLAEEHHLILAVRDEERGRRARTEILQAHPSASIDVAHLDLADLASVRALGATDLAVDVLVNNAGIAFEAQGQFATNHLGHFALTALLHPRLSRVVTVTSTLAKKGALDLDAIGRGSPMRNYAQSKLANLLFAAELARRSEKLSILAHPGVPQTAMQRDATGLIGVVVRTAVALIGHSAAHGATALQAAATSTTSKSGDIWAPGPKPEPHWRTLNDQAGAAALWKKSEALTGLHFL